MGEIHLVSGLEQGAQSRGVEDKLSLSGPRPFIPISGRTTYHEIPAPKRTGIAVARVLVKISGQFL
jgi:hypothetical protein